jgi:ribosomal-protein-alanine N-acetyltransferase
MAVPRRLRRAGRLVTDAPFRIRPAQAADIPALVALERIAFSDPWSPGDFADCRAAGWPILVAENDTGVVAYVVGRAVLDEAEILNLAVAVPARRRGIARALVRDLIAAFAERGVSSLFLEVRESNHAARGLYASFGFREVGRRQRYYHQPVEDAVVLRAVISADRASA